MSHIDLQEAIDRGFQIDRRCYPWVAYRGPRFSPIEWHYTETQREWDLARKVDDLEDLIMEMGEQE